MMFFILLIVGFIGIIGPFYFPDLQFAIYAFILTYYLFKTGTMAVGMLINYRKNKIIMAQRGAFKDSNINQLSNHVFIIPSYKEDI